MSQVIDAPPVAAAPQPHGALAKDALGLPAVLFCIVTGAAPLAAMMFNVPVAVSGGGYAVPAAFLVATIALTIFSTGYIEMSQRVTSTGGFFTFISRGLGNVMGLGSGILIALCYVIFAAAVTGVLGYFASTTVDDWFGLSMPAYVYMFGALALMTGFAWFHIELTARILGVALIAEVLALVAMCIGIIVTGGPDGYSAAPLNPANLFDNDAALKVFGAAATGVAIFGAFWSWVGFEMAPNYAEESRDPHKIAKAATYGSVIGLGLFYIFVSYMFVTGWGLTGSAQAVADQFEGKYASAFYPLTDKYVGGGLTTILQLLIVTSSFACAMAFYNTGARYLFALAREGVLPKALGRTHAKRHGPVIAAMVVIIDRRPLHARLHDHGLEHRGRAAQARHLDAAARRARHPRRAGHLLGGDHPLLPDRGARRLPLVQDARGAAGRRAGHGRRVLPADLQPRRALGRGRLHLHQGHTVGGARRLRGRDGAGPRHAQSLQGDLRQDRPLQPRGDPRMSMTPATAYQGTSLSISGIPEVAR